MKSKSQHKGTKSEGRHEAARQAKSPALVQMAPVSAMERASLALIKNSPVVTQAFKVPQTAPTSNQQDVAQLYISHDTPEKPVDGLGRATKVAVNNIRGQSFAEGHNNPTNNNVYGWQQLHAAGHTLGNTGPNNSHYNAVRMHLWNGRLDGPGNQAWNLAPGPAWVNSSMSAGPEMAAKLAVDAGFWIWLDTRVSYASGNNNANDFKNVIPNRMQMQWGYMEKDGEPFNKLFSLTSLDKGDPVGGTWSQDIDQPAGALSNELKDKYRNLDASDTDGLEDLFRNAGYQEKAQALHLVDDALKKHIIEHHHNVFYVLGDDTKVEVLNDLLSEEEAVDLMVAIYSVYDLKGIISQAFEPLISKGKYARLRYLFSRVNPSTQRELLILGKDYLANALGDVADDLFFTDYTLFRYLSVATQWNKVQSTSNNTVKGLLEVIGNNSEIARLFDSWAMHNNKVRGYAKLSFINSVFGSGSLKSYVTLYKKQLKWELNNEKVKHSARNKKVFNDEDIIPRFVYETSGYGKAKRKKNPAFGGGFSPY